MKNVRERLVELVMEIDEELPLLQVRIESPPDTHAEFLRLQGTILTLQQRKSDAARLLQSLES